MPLKLNDVFDLEYFIELSPDLICVAGYDGYFKKVNSAVLKTLGYTKEELFARPIDSFVHPDDRAVTSKKRENIKKDNPLLNFENRYLTKTGEIVWLTWTSIPIKNEKVVFAIAKNITHQKKSEVYRRVPNVNKSGQKNIIQQEAELLKVSNLTPATVKSEFYNKLSSADKAWLSDFELLVRKYTGKIDININMLSNDMAISERQLYRRIKTMTGVTPNQYIRGIRLQLAREAVETGKYRTISEIANAAGFETTTYFGKLFRDIFGYDVNELL